MQPFINFCSFTDIGCFPHIRDLQQQQQQQQQKPLKEQITIETHGSLHLCLDVRRFCVVTLKSVLSVATVKTDGEEVECREERGALQVAGGREDSASGFQAQS